MYLTCGVFEFCEHPGLWNYCILEVFVLCWKLPTALMFLMDCYSPYLFVLHFSSEVLVLKNRAGHFQSANFLHESAGCKILTSCCKVAPTVVKEEQEGQEAAKEVKEEQEEEEEYEAEQDDLDYDEARSR
jgi:hypothetical protein